MDADDVIWMGSSFQNTTIIKKDIHILLIGPVSNTQENLIGGATISFGYLIDYLKVNGEAFTLINTKPYINGWKRLLNPVLIITKVLFHIFKTDVVFLNSSRGGTKYLVPILAFSSKMFGRKFVFRPFGGNIKTYTANYSPFWQWILHKSFLNTDILFLQTHFLINYYNKLNYNTIHLPTSRNPTRSFLKKPALSFKKRFIYLGAIEKTKGIDEMIAVSKQLTDDYTLHLYGPITDMKYKYLSEQEQGLYHGVLEKKEVLKKLNEYDVLILPTYYEGEGYPGVIIEAYSLGIPVISTHWLAIPEIVEHGKSGLLIEPQSSNALLEAILHFNIKNYAAYAKNAHTLFDHQFNADKVIQQAVNAIKYGSI